MAEEKHAARILWRGIAIDITLTINWLGGTAHHLELRADRPLPVTETGYGSHFLSADEEIDIEWAKGFVIPWLNEAADGKSWRKAEERRRQGDFFDHWE